MKRAVLGIAWLTVTAQPLAAQFPRLAPPPPCKASISAPAYVSYWAGASDARPKVAVFTLHPDVDDAARVYLSVAIP